MARNADPRLNALVAAAAPAFGLTSSSAAFMAAKEFSFRWQTGGGRLSLWVSDYLEDAPDDALEDFVNGALGFICKKRKQYGPAYLDYTASDAFVLAKRPVYLRRSRNLTRSDRGRTRCLYDAAQRLLDGGLIGPNDLDNALLTWTVSPNFRKLGYCSPMMKVVAVSSVFDSERVPEFACDYVLYHECLHLRQGYRPFVTRHHDAAFRREEHLFPQWQEADRILRNLPRNPSCLR